MWIKLESLAPWHAEGLAEAARLGAYAFTPVPHGRREALAYISRARSARKAGRSLAFAVIDRRDDRILGSTRFKNLYRWTPRSIAPNAVEIGNSWISDAARGSGTNLEAKLLLLRHAFDTWGVRRVSMQVDTRNDRSRAAVEKLGATCEGVWRAHSLGLDGELRSVASYSVLAEEWPAVREIIEMRLSLHPAPAYRLNVPA
ncbi:GNAT family protein [Streptomyces sp. NPDC048270]|uniref:GNAT family N-acetyltransferase n=1 Tax=Streptomyces sp. NPDC048270 TaxID=3154615 RepID=UPI0033E3F3DD